MCKSLGGEIPANMIKKKHLCKIQNTTDIKIKIAHNSILALLKTRVRIATK
jgi:hypothetical protein